MLAQHSGEGSDIWMGLRGGFDQAMPSVIFYDNKSSDAGILINFDPAIELADVQPEELQRRFGW